MSYALITGASSGIGWATAKLLAQNNYHLILLARREERLQSLKNELKASAVEVHTAAVDVRERSSLEQIFKKLEPQLRKMRVLVNNAGLAKGTEPVAAGNVGDWDEMLDTNLKGLLHVTQLSLPYLKAQDSAHIVNMGSISSRQIYPGGAVYCASKFGVRVISEALRMELLGSNIHVTTIAPGMVETEFSEVRFEGDKEKAKSVYKGMEPLTAEDIAESVLWSINRPKRVNIQEIILTPLSQARVDRIHRQ